MKARSGFKAIAKLYVRIAVLAMLAIVASGCAGSADKAESPEAKAGAIDLEGWDWERNGPVALNGEWAFEWLGDRDRSDLPDRLATTIRVPGIWGAMPTGDGDRLPDKGHAVYRLNVLHLPADRQLAMRVPNIMTAYELFVDGELLVARGVPGRDAEGTVPYQVPATVYFNANGSSTELELHVANFEHRRGGIRTTLLLGPDDQIQKIGFNQEAQEMIVFGCLIMIGFYHFGLYALRRQEIANLLFALLCLFVALRMGAIGVGMFVQWIPGFTWTLAIRTEYIGFAVSAWAGYGYFHRMYPKEVKRFGFVGASYAAIALVLFALAAPPYVFTNCLVAYQLYVLLLGFSALLSLMLAGIRRREGAKLALVGVAGLLLAIVNDMLFYNGMRQSIDLVPIGLLFLIIMNSFIISLRFSQTYERAEQLSAELIDWNSSLEQKIAERTEELQRSYITVENAKSELERAEQARKQLVSNISHDLRTPITLLQGYLEALKDDVITDEKQRDATIRLMLTKVEGLNALIQDLFEISVLEARKVELIAEKVTLGDWRRHLLEQYAMELEQRDIRFECRLAHASIALLEVSVDLPRMNRVFANLVYNAVRYTPVGGRIAVTIDADAALGIVKLVLTDSGCGFDPDDLPHLFDRFYKNDRSRHSNSGGSGLGLAIVKEIVELHGGTICAYNVPEGGGAFEIRLPIVGEEAKHAG